MMYRLLLLLPVILFISCTTEPVAGGPGSETTNGIIAQVFDSEGNPATNASMALRKVSYSPETPILFDKVISPDILADSVGKIALDSVPDGFYRITIEQDGEMLSREITFKDSLNLGKLYLKKSGSFTGSVALPSESKYAWVGIYGLDLLVKTDSLGNFTLPELPAADDSLSLYIRNEVYQDTLREKHIFIKSNLDLKESNETLLQDFEGTSYDDWYFSRDTVNAIIKSPLIFNDGIIYDSTRQSKVFHGSYEMKLTWAWVVFGMAIKNGPLNFNQLDSISFRAKGNGFIRVQLENWDKESEVAGTNLKTYSPYKMLTLDKWSYIVVKPENFCEVIDENTNCDNWEATKRYVKQIHLFVNSGTDVYIDDIKLYGVQF